MGVRTGVRTGQLAGGAGGQSAARKILLIGASRGLGLGLAKLFAARGWNLVATERAISAGLKAAADAVDRRFRIEHVDITNHDQIEKLRRSLSGEVFDVIFIVAGVRDDTTKPIHAVPASEAARLFITNAYSPIYLAEALFGLLKPQGTLAIMSSRMGSLPRHDLHARRMGNLSRQQGGAKHARPLLLPASSRRRTHDFDHASRLGENRDGRRRRAGRYRHQRRRPLQHPGEVARQRQGGLCRL
jgi:hypothetical protein